MKPDCIASSVSHTFFDTQVLVLLWEVELGVPVCENSTQHNSTTPEPTQKGRHEQLRCMHLTCVQRHHVISLPATNDYTSCVVHSGGLSLVCMVA